MKVIRFLTAAALVLTASTAMAQGGPPMGGAPQGGGQGFAQRQMEMLFKDITLTDAQKAKVDSIMTASREESMKLRQEMQAAGGPPSDELRAKMTAITTKRNDALKGVLTPDQQAVFAKNLENMPQGGGRRPPR